MNTFEVTILGCSSASPTPDRHQSAQLLRFEDKHILIDCGEGTQNQIFKYHLRYNKISVILISHLHGDHFLGLPGLLATMSLNGRTESLTIIAPTSIEDYIQHFFRLSETHLNFQVEYIICNPEESENIYENEKLYISTIPLYHRISCVGYKIQTKSLGRKINKEKCDEYKIPIAFMQSLKNGNDYINPDGTMIKNEVLTLEPLPQRVYAYISDTLYSEKIIPHIQYANVLYHESTFLHDMIDRANETYHTTSKQAAEIAVLAQVKKLIIGHFSARYKDLNPLLEEATAVFSQTKLAIEGETFQIV